MADAELDVLEAFRAAVYAAFGRRRDALFELLDASLTSGLVPSLAHLSLACLHRRGWGSLYGALAQGRIDVPALRALVAGHPLAEGAPVYAVDTSAWPRNDAEASPERAYHYHPSRHSAGKPIVAGWSSSWLAQVGIDKLSGFTPVTIPRCPSRPPVIRSTAAIASLRRSSVTPCGCTTGSPSATATWRRCWRSAACR